MSKEEAKSCVEENIELIQEDDERLKGDAIGDTLYSESFILKTLMNLTAKLPVYSRESNTSDNLDDEAVELEESLETDLCLLWDMTADRDVALCLIQHDILDIMKCVMEESIAPRLTEIGIGILANLSCQNEISAQIILDQELTTAIVNLMTISDDSQTIIQIVRLLNTLLAHSQIESCISLPSLEALVKSVAFILQNSLNEELLIGSSKLLDAIASQIGPMFEIPFESLLRGIVEAQKQLKNFFSCDESNYPETVQDSFDALVSALYNFSRNEEMRVEIEHVTSFLEFYFTLLLKNIRDAEEVVADSTASALKAITIFYVTIASASPRSNILELSGRIGSQLRSCLDGESEASKYASDYRDLTGDCFRKQLDVFGIEHSLSLLESLDAEALTFVLQAAHQTVPNRLKEFADTARSRGSFNKVMETYDSLAKNNAR
ncbi:hypothetical protein DAPPUDRAFT_99313 [Daphnia pulex]|uniref:Beta-catenin-like protein 1 N-terminal domain-containing protein n=1 Tax=Daphnia pulex TaxID=6669 RepID=E9G6B8_DAPPU|nr:hypothetical protein DAPPUDRAFT_99313 [Daphnia pulex]|eukprot:EFX84907.1 hypothetical protein DAPPUDRAFT_99313 [Daphnia pulex]